jgi:hypothetical protein
MIRRLMLCSFAFGALFLVTPTTDAVAETVKNPGPSKDAKKGKKGKKGKDGKKGKNGKKGDDFKGPFKKAKYPKEARLRPLVLPDGMGEVIADAGFSRAFDTNFLGLTGSFAYGIGDSFDLGASTGLLLAPDVDWNGSLVLQGHYLAVDERDFDWAPGLQVPVFRDAFGDVGLGVTLDLPGRYIVSDQVFFTFGQGAVPIGLTGDVTMAIVANGGIGFQVDKSILIFADTSVLTLLLIPDADITGIWDYLTLRAGVQYAIDRNIDVGGALSVFNVWQDSDFLTIGIDAFGRFRF